MGDNAARAAAAAATRAANDVIRARSAKDMPAILNLIPNLMDVEFHVFVRSLESAAFFYGWPAWILDMTDNGVHDNLSVSDQCHVRNAFVVMQRRCQGHTITDTLDDCKQGDAKAMYTLIHGHFFRPTFTGRQLATRTLYSMTMATTDTNITQFLALASRNVRAVEANGSPVDDNVLIGIILSGLLDEFEPIKLVIEEKGTMNLVTTKFKLIDYATSRGILELTKSGNKGSHNRSYGVQGKNKNNNNKRQREDGSTPTVPGTTWKGKAWKGVAGDCQQFMQDGKCTWPGCKFKHPGRTEKKDTPPANKNEHVTLNAQVSKSDTNNKKPNSTNANFCSNCGTKGGHEAGTSCPNWSTGLVVDHGEANTYASHTTDSDDQGLTCMVDEDEDTTDSDVWNNLLRMADTDDWDVLHSIIEDTNIVADNKDLSCMIDEDENAPDEDDKDDNIFADNKDEDDNKETKKFNFCSSSPHDEDEDEDKDNFHHHGGEDEEDQTSFYFITIMMFISMIGYCITQTVEVIRRPKFTMYVILFMGTLIMAHMISHYPRMLTTWKRMLTILSVTKSTVYLTECSSMTYL